MSNLTRPKCIEILPSLYYMTDRISRTRFISPVLTLREFLDEGYCRNPDLAQVQIANGYTPHKQAVELCYSGIT